MLPFAFAILIPQSNTLAIHVSQCDLPIITNVMDLSDVIRVNGQASIPVRFCWGWIW